MKWRFYEDCYHDCSYIKKIDKRGRKIDDKTGQKIEDKRKWKTQGIFLGVFALCLICLGLFRSEYDSSTLIIVWIIWGIFYMIIVHIVYKWGVSSTDGEKIFNILDVTYFTVLIALTLGINSKFVIFYVFNIILICLDAFNQKTTLRRRNLIIIASIFAIFLNYFWATYNKTYKSTDYYITHYFFFILGCSLLAFIISLILSRNNDISKT